MRVLFARITWSRSPRPKSKTSPRQPEKLAKPAVKDSLSTPGSAALSSRGPSPSQRGRTPLQATRSGSSANPLTFIALERRAPEGSFGWRSKAPRRRRTKLS